MKRFHHKRNKINLTILFLVWFLNAFSQHTFIPTGTTTDIDEIRKFGNVVVINGDYQFLKKCYDDCDQLISLTPLTSPNIYNKNGCLIMLDTSLFFVRTYDPNLPYQLMVSKTSNGGLTWDPVFENNVSSAARLLVFDTNNINILLEGENYSYITSNGGVSWQQQPQTNVTYIGPAIRISNSVGVYVEGEDLVYSTNQGVSWERTQNTGLYTTALFAPTQDSIYFLSETMQSQLYFSYQFGGFQSTRIDKIVPNFYGRGVYAVSKDEIYVTGMALPQNVGRILKTTDLGNTWSYYDVPGTMRLSELVFLNDSIALIGGQNGTLLKWNKNSPMTEWDLGMTENTNEIFSAIAYPNPASQYQELEIQAVAGDKIEIQLYDLQGRNCGLVFSGIAESNQEKIQINVTHLDAGVYVYQLRVGNNSGQLRFVKQ